ncbi:hypothetical protein H2203_008295 [Taxawa tesnikishii (nom. ined.)]|nr:hypothetical protein H2203_008295 [Dothideales sp. JES 119]
MATLDYLRKLHEGHIFYFSTLSYTPASLSHLPSMQPSKLGRRATNYFILGTSIPPLLDLNSGNPLDYLRAFAALLAEFDTYQQLNESGASAGLTRNRMGAMFNRGMRGVKGRRSSAATDSLLADLGSLNASTSAFPSVPGQAGEAGQDFLYLQTPSLPFDPDFSTSFATLADILVDAYAGILQLLPSPERCVPAVAEAFAKADKAVRKILIQGLMKEFEDGARKEI